MSINGLVGNCTPRGLSQSKCTQGNGVAIGRRAELVLQVSDEYAGEAVDVTADDHWMCKRCKTPLGLRITTRMSRLKVNNGKSIAKFYGLVGAVKTTARQNSSGPTTPSRKRRAPTLPKAAPRN